MEHQQSAPRLAVVLVIDQVGSTNFLVTHGEPAAARVTSEHGDAVANIVDALGGRLEGSTGDGYIASFGLGSAALDAAVEIQRAAQRLSATYPEPVQIRIGVAVGEVHHDGLDLRGWPLFQAARLCDGAADGKILASRTLLDVVATRSDHVLGDTHSLDLKGVGRPTEAVEIEWQRPDDSDEVTLNPELAILEQRPWVGRAEPVAALLDEVTATDRPRLLVISGESGAGKSRLIARFAAEAAERGRRVMYGAAPRDPSSSYAPIISALRAALDALRPDVRSSVLVGSVGRELSRLLPDLGGPGREILHATDGPGAHRLLMEGIGEVLERLGEQGHGLVFVVDDLQWADDATMATIRHLAGPSGPRNLTVVGAIRAPDIDMLTQLMADVSRQSRVTKLDLEGLAADEIAALIGEIRPSLDDNQVVRTAEKLATRTGGNALFVTSLVHDPEWTDAVLTGEAERQLPTELSVAIAERLADVDPDDVATLTTASVIGHRFPARLLADIAGQAPESIAATIGRARQAGLLQDLGGGQVGFVHDLVRLALMPPADSFELAVVHRSVAEQLEHQPDPDISATAGHFLRGLDAGASVDKAVDWVSRAGRQSMRQLSYGRAVRHFGDALGVLGPDDERGLELTVQLGRAQLYGGDPAYRETLLDAVDRSLRAGRPDRAAEAALANNRGLYSAAGEVDDDRIAALKRVLAEDHEPAVRSQLTATLALESVFTGASAQELDSLSQEAVDLARQSGDRTALVHALTMRQDANYGIDNLDERRQETDELLELTIEGDPRSRFWAIAHRVITLGEAGEWDDVARMVTEAESIAAATREPILEWYAAVLSGALAIQQDDLAGAQSIIDRGYALGLDTGQPDALIPTSGQQCEVLRRRGRFDTIHELAAANLDEDLLRASAPMRAVLFLEEGHLDRAQQVWESTGLQGALDVPAAQVGHNLIHARRLAAAFPDPPALETIDDKLAGVPPFLFCNYWESTVPAS